MSNLFKKIDFFTPFSCVLSQNLLNGTKANAFKVAKEFMSSPNRTQYKIKGNSKPQSNKQKKKNTGIKIIMYSF